MSGGGGGVQRSPWNDSVFTNLSLYEGNLWLSNYITGNIAKVPIPYI